MRVLIVNEFIDPATGGATGYVLGIIGQLVGQGHKVFVMHGEAGKDIRISGVKRVDAYAGIMGINYAHDPETIRCIESAAHEIAPELVYIHQVINPAVVSVFVGTWPCVRFEHGFRLLCPSGRNMKMCNYSLCDHRAGIRCLLYAYTQRCMPRNPLHSTRRVIELKKNQALHRRMQGIIVASRFMERLFEQNGFDRKKVSVIPYFTSMPERASRAGEQERPLILFVGRIIKEKGGHFLIKAVRSIERPLKICIVGDGPDVENLKELAREYTTPHEYEFAGWVDNVKISQFYQKASALVVPSLWPEPFGIVGIEAMANGLPVVGFDVGGISDWLRHEQSGILVQRGNIDELARAIRLLVEDRELNHSLGAKGRAIAMSEYTVGQHMRQLTPLLESVAQQ